MDVILRPELYRLLKRVFGKVKVCKPGQAIKRSLVTEDDGRSHYIFNEGKGDDWGEYYSICCPICRDHRFRLSINHMWGHRDETTKTLNLNLIQCHHQNCFRDYDQRRIFYEQLFGGGVDEVNDSIRPGIKETKPFGEIEWPGTVWPLNRVEPDHIARVYLRGRRFDPDWLAEQFRVGFLLHPAPRLWYLKDRIIIPVFFDNKLVGWQARLAREPKDKQELKYISMNNLPRGRILYNFDQARLYPFVVVVEGPMDVWRFGPEAVALLGQIAGAQTNLLTIYWKTVIIMLDEDAKKNSADLLAILRQSLPGRVVEVHLPPARDPGAFESTLELRQFVAASLKSQNFVL
jgi:hypothetical protein